MIQTDSDASNYESDAQTSSLMTKKKDKTDDFKVPGEKRQTTKKFPKSSALMK